MSSDNDTNGITNIDLKTVSQLIATQFPKWRDLHIQPVKSTGTDNTLFRLGNKMAIRIPRVDSAIEQAEKERQWLPVLSPKLPFDIPLPLAYGKPDETCPLSWSIYTWLEGEDGNTRAINKQNLIAADLARFITALQQISSTDGPAPGRHNNYRGTALAKRGVYVQAAIASLGDLIDSHAVKGIWQDSLQAEVWQKSPIWIHGDLHPGNLLIRDTRLVGIIDFGLAGVGDPACDLMIAWNFLNAESRITFRDSLAVDDDTWARGRGWALSMALIALPYYLDSNPSMVTMSKRIIDELIRYS